LTENTPDATINTVRCSVCGDDCRIIIYSGEGVCSQRCYEIKHKGSSSILREVHDAEADPILSNIFKTHDLIMGYLYPGA
jgi:hypothetical protein